MSANEMQTKENEQRQLRAVAPAIDIYEEKEAFHVLADMPGVPEKDVNVHIEDDVLSIAGDQCELAMEGMALLGEGYGRRRFERKFNLLADIENEKIEAKMNNGVLHVMLPKSEKAKPRKITVNAG